MTEKIVFLDLEDTVIDTFADGNLVRTAVVRRFLAQERPQRVALFSYALWDERDRRNCERRLVLGLQESLGVALDLTISPTIDDLRRIVERTRRMAAGSLSQQDFFDWFGRKEEGFIQFARFGPGFEGQTLVLLDDMVPEMELRMPASDLIVRTVPVQSL